MTQSTSAIAIVGMGCWYPGSKGLTELWENVLARRQQFRRFSEKRHPAADYFDADPRTPDKCYIDRGASIDGFIFDYVARQVPKGTAEATDIVQWLCLEVALSAMADAGYTRDTLPRERTAVMVGNTLGGEQTLHNAILRTRFPFVRRALRAAAEAHKLSATAVAELEKTFEHTFKSALLPVTEDSLQGLLPNCVAGRLCNYMDIHGGGYTVDGACASSLLAISQAASALANGEIDLAFAGGIEINFNPAETVGFSKAGTFARGDMKVFDKRASGFLPGEGCGVVILKRLEDARREGRYVYATLRGWGMSSDGKGSMIAPSSDGQGLAIRRAYEQAGYKLSDVDFVECHGTGTERGDKTELTGLAKVVAAEKTGFEAATPRSCGLTSLKSIIGHTKAAAGVGGFIKSVLSVNRRIVPPTAGCEEPNTHFFDATVFYPLLNGEIREPTSVMRAGISAFGFGGINCHVTIESADPPCDRINLRLDERGLLASQQSHEIFVLSAGSLSGLRERLAQVAVEVGTAADGELADYSAKLVSDVEGQGSFRATLVAATVPELMKAIAELETMLERDPPSKGAVKSNPTGTVFVGNSVRKNRIGFLYPGQGSQQLNMARSLVARYRWARELVEKADEWLAGFGFGRLSEHMFRSIERAASADEIERWSKKLARTEIAQPAICLASLLWTEHLHRLGISPSIVAGHSLGELSAFHAAGGYDAKTLLELAATRGKAMASPAQGPAGAMMSLTCSREQAENLIRGIAGDIVIANINSPKQIVVAGASETIDRVGAAAAAHAISARRLPVSNAFHSQFVAPAARVVSEFSFARPKLDAEVQILSGIDGTIVSKGSDLREHFTRQLTAQVNFSKVVSSLERSCDVLLEVGPGRVLSDLVRHNVPSDDMKSYPVEGGMARASDHLCALSAYFVRGGNPNWAALFEARLIREFVPAAKKVFVEGACGRRPFTVPSDVLSLASEETTTSVDALAKGLGGLDENELADYLRRRGAFLAAVMRADLATDGSERVEPGYIEPKRRSAALADAPSDPSRQTEQPVLDRKPQVDVTTVDATQRSAAMSDAWFVPLIQRATELVALKLGHAVALTGASKLSDVGLEELQIAELISILAREHGAERRIDPFELSELSLNDVALAISVKPGEPSRRERESDPSAPKRKTTLPAEEARHDAPRNGAASSGVAAIAPSVGTAPLPGHDGARSPDARIGRIVEHVMRLVCEVTGYPASSVFAESRLLSDLNLDSIKAGELVATAAKDLGAGGKLDPLALASSSIREVAIAIAEATSPAEEARHDAPRNGAASSGVAAITSSVGTAPLPGHDGARPPDARIGRIVEHVMRLVCEVTGYPASSVFAESRLLSDLNLDSIKAGELVATAAKDLGAGGKLDPLALASSSIREVAIAIAEATSPSEEARHDAPRNGAAPSAAAAIAPSVGTAPLPGHDGARSPDARIGRIVEHVMRLVCEVTGYPASSVFAESRLLSDLNLDSIKAGELVATAAKDLGAGGKLDPLALASSSIREVAIAIAEATSPAEEARYDAPRNGSVAAIAPSVGTALAPDPASFPSEHLTLELVEMPPSTREEDTWQDASILVVADLSDARTLDALTSSVKARGARRITTVSFESLNSQFPEEWFAYTHVIAISSRPTPQSSLSASALGAAIGRLHNVARLTSFMGIQRSSASLAFVQFGDGFFGTRHPEHASVDAGCAVSFFASIRQERSKLKVRVIELSAATRADFVAGCVVSELSTHEGFLAVAYDDALTRRVRRFAPLARSSYRTRPNTWTSEDVFLVTGGGRGITAECVLTLGTATGARFALVGSSPYTNDPSSELHRTLRRLEEAGIAFRYYQCDVSKKDSVHALVHAIRHELGAITGVVHGAAVNHPARVEGTSVDSAIQETSPKLLGALNLWSALRSTPPRLFVGFSSIIGASGMAGNAWYAYSNEVLDLCLRKFASEAPEMRTLSIAFGAWDEVGIAVRTGLAKRLAHVGGALSVADGTSQFVHLVSNDPGDYVVVAMPMAASETFPVQRDAKSVAKSNRFAENVLELEVGTRAVVRPRLSAARDPYLLDHLFRGSALLPTVFGLEAMAQVVALAIGRDLPRPLRIENIELTRPVVVPLEQELELEIRAEVERGAAQGGSFRSVKAEIRTAKTAFAFAHFSATFVLSPEVESRVPHLSAPAPLGLDPKIDLYGSILWQGVRFQQLERVETLAENHGQFLIRQLRDNTRAETSFPLASPSELQLGDPYARDVLLQTSQIIATPELGLPLRIRSLTLSKAASTMDGFARAQVRLGHREGRRTSWDVDVVDERGELSERLIGYETHTIERSEALPELDDLLAKGYRPTASKVSSAISDEEALRRSLTKQCARFDVSAPHVTLESMPGLHELTREDRRAREATLLRRAVSEVTSGAEEAVNIAHATNGAPIVTGTFSRMNLALSHDDTCCLVVAGTQPQGCDVMEIKARSSEMWEALVGPMHLELLRSIVADHRSSSVDRFGTAIWAAREAGLKALGSEAPLLSIIKQDGDACLFEASVKVGRVLVVTLPFGQNPEKVVAIVVHELPKQRIQTSRQAFSN